MGACIAGVIPIKLKPRIDRWTGEMDREEFSPSFFDFYVEGEDGTYTLKKEVLVENYQSFLTEFYEIIGEDIGEIYGDNTEFLDVPMAFPDVPVVSTCEEFDTAFNRNARKSYIPHLAEIWSGFSMRGGECLEFWVFYRGSSELYIEDYSTMTHFERTLRRAMKNPLVNLLKFGIFG